jgi:hypothetical protein
MLQRSKGDVAVKSCPCCGGFVSRPGILRDYSCVNAAVTRIPGHASTGRARVERFDHAGEGHREPSSLPLHPPPLPPPPRRRHRW